MYILNDNSMGGATHSLLEILGKIRNDVHPVVVVREEGPASDRMMEQLDALCIPCYRISFPTDILKSGEADEKKREQDIKQGYEAAMQLLLLVEKEKIHLIHINSSISYFAAITALMAGIPYVWHIRELMDEHYGYEFVNEDLKKYLYGKADRLIVISDYVRQRYHEKYALDNMEKIYNGIDIGKYKTILDENRDYKNIFLVAAMISHEKGQWDVIRATEQLLEKGYSDVQVIITGSHGGGYVWALGKYIKTRNLDHNIKILPFQSDLSKLRKQASYAITASQCEALGRVVIESMLAGNVLIGARSGATTELIGSKEERGFLFELHDSDALAHAMERAMQCSKEAKNQMTKEAQVFAEGLFDSEQYCKKMTELYEDVIVSYLPKDSKRFLAELKQCCHFSNQKAISKIPENTQIPKAKAAFALAVTWLEIKQKGFSLAEYFRKKHIYSVAIYGMADLGRRLYDELENTEIEIKYLLDQNPGGMEKILPFASFYKEKPEVDVIVVTVAAAEKQIVKEIRMKGYENVIGLSDILNDFI